MKTTTNHLQQGFTIVEVLIVIAVAGFLLAASIVYLAGQTNQSDFTVAVNNLKQQLEQTISEVSKGYYPSNSDFTCNTTISSQHVTITPGNTNQGTNYGCIFLGKLIQFSPMGASPGQFIVYPIAGFQYTPSGQVTQTLYESDPAIPVLVPFDFDTQTLEYGLTVQSVETQSGSGPVSTDAIAILAGDSSGNLTNGYDANNNLYSGSQPFSLYYDTMTSLSTNVVTSSQLAQDVQTTSPNGLQYTSNVAICVVGGQNQSALIQIGSPDYGLEVSDSVYNDNTCS